MMVMFRWRGKIESSQLFEVGEDMVSKKGKREILALFQISFITNVQKMPE